MIAYSIVNSLTGERIIGPLSDDEIPNARDVALAEKDRLTAEAARGHGDDLAPHTVNGEAVSYELELVDHGKHDAELKVRQEEGAERAAAVVQAQEADLDRRIDEAVERSLAGKASPGVDVRPD